MNIFTLIKRIINKKNDNQLIESYSLEFYSHLSYTFSAIRQLLNKDQIVNYKKLRNIIIDYEENKEKAMKMKIDIYEFFDKHHKSIEELKKINTSVENFNKDIDFIIIRDTFKDANYSPPKIYTIGTRKFIS